MSRYTKSPERQPPRSDASVAKAALKSVGYGGKKVSES
jgi:hypothetical protein